MSRTSIETVTGELLDYACPTKEMISIEAIGWGTARQPRFCGQTVGEVPYSVAQHQVYVMGVINMVMTPGSYLNKLMISTTTDADLVRFLSTPYLLQDSRLLAMFLGLFHDGSEAFLCDIPTPAKRLPGLKEAYMAIEGRLMDAIHDKLGITAEMITPEIAAIVHWADQYALAVEAWHLVPSRGQGEEWSFLITPDPVDLLTWPAPVSTSAEAFEVFMTAYEYLLEGGE
jgi:hypothetical protein